MCIYIQTYLRSKNLGNDSYYLAILSSIHVIPVNSRDLNFPIFSEKWLQNFEVPLMLPTSDQCLISKLHSIKLFICIGFCLIYTFCRPLTTSILFLHRMHNTKKK